LLTTSPPTTTTTTTTGKGINDFISSPEKLQNVAVAGTAIFAGYFATRESAKTVGSIIR